jgi:hypothetical protein
MKRAWTAAVFAVTALCAAAEASETIVAREEEKYFYEGGRFERYEGQYEKTYFLDVKDDKLVRTRLYDYQAKKITPDETSYRIQKQLQSYPLSAPRYGLEPVVTAFGQPDADTVEMLVIDKDSVQTVTAAGGRLVVARAKRLR